DLARAPRQPAHQRAGRLACAGERRSRLYLRLGEKKSGSEPYFRRRAAVGNRALTPIFHLGLASPAHLAGLAREQAALAAQPVVRPALVRVDAALLGEEAGKLRIARFGLGTRGLGRAGDRKAAAVD